ncbi:MAG: DUF3883 domain-containing protein [Chitinophagaceae bacterium]
MNIQLLKQYITDYKQNFDYINKEELYKWKAVKHFQENWDIDSVDFPAMLKNSIKKTVNLLRSGQYFPLRMLLYFVEKEPETVRQLFRNLYDEKLDIGERITNFQTQTKQINEKYFPEKKNTYQDQRAIIVYLTLHYPEIYYLFKFEMYKTFSKKLELTFTPKAAKMETIFHFNKICNIVRHYISQDQELLKLHNDRLTDDCYIDEKLHILTQDFIYAVSQHLNKIEASSIIIQSAINQTIAATDLSIINDALNFTGRFVNFIENSIEAKRIGDLGEIWVYEQEKRKLTDAGLSNLAEKVKHISNDNGDGTGYDIESYDLKGNKLFIEVKTTKGNFNATFYVSRNELERSKKEQDNYSLYRVFKYDENNNTAECKIIQGDLSNICSVPINYKVTLKAGNNV